MSERPDAQSDLDALNELIVNCPDFDRLEALLGGFNLFQVLKFEHGEIRHSNVLAWIMDPNESHGLDATFLKKWLMRIIHEVPEECEAPVSAVDIDGWQLTDVEVRREWRNIDLLIVLNLVGGEEWVICIENKVNSVQHSSQLSRYRKIVEENFPSAARRIFLFLTKSEEVPEDCTYLRASYAQVHRTLNECVQSRSHAIGVEPKVLLENYLRLLEEKFMDESEIARTALRIYQQHRRALDIIYEHRPDNLRMASERVQKLLAEHAKENGMIMESYSKSYIRFIPESWAHSGNSHGGAWAGTSRTIVFEMNLTGKRPYLSVISGKAPDAWIEPVWQRAASPPFRRPRRAVRPRMWCMLHTAEAPRISLEDEDVEDPPEIAQRIYEWAVSSFKALSTQEVIKIISAELPKLEAIHTAGKSLV
jgi:hypothetical protein